MVYQDTFQRHELKYLLSPQQKSAVFAAMQGHMEGDRFQDSSISNLYFDTPDFLLIRRSLEKPTYKEKLRMRSYGIAKPDAMVFIELKKKYKSVVYKRRVSLPLAQAENFLLRGSMVGPAPAGHPIPQGSLIDPAPVRHPIPQGSLIGPAPVRHTTPQGSTVGTVPAGHPIPQGNLIGDGSAGHPIPQGSQGWKTSQILKEISYFWEFYQTLAPALFLSYQREAFSGIQEPGLRITFDENILWRREQLSLRYGAFGNSLLPPGATLMEIKTPGAMPLWLAHALSAHGISKTSFSKYGKAYEEILEMQSAQEDRLRHVS